jgi:chloramphenicol-sensitive protein RarD
MLETALLAPFALLFLFYWEGSGRGHFLSAPLDIKLLLPLSGPITAIPLTLYAAGARRIPLSLLGILQYIAPIGQFLAGVLFYNEPFPPYKQVGFAIIWLALLIFTSEGLWMRRQQEQGAALLPAR